MAVGSRMASRTGPEVGDKVRWKTGDDATYGKVVEKSTSKTLSSNQGDYELEGTEQEPAYKTAVYEQAGGSWQEQMEDGRRVETVHRESELTTIRDFPEQPS